MQGGMDMAFVAGRQEGGEHHRHLLLANNNRQDRQNGRGSPAGLLPQGRGRGNSGAGKTGRWQGSLPAAHHAARAPPAPAPTSWRLAGLKGSMVASPLPLFKTPLAPPRHSSALTTFGPRQHAAASGERLHLPGGEHRRAPPALRRAPELLHAGGCGSVRAFFILHGYAPFLLALPNARCC